MSNQPVRVAFVCIQNAGRSQMATAFAKQERRERGLENAVEVTTGGTHPADSVHDNVIVSMKEVGIDLTERTPQTIAPDELDQTDIVVTMGCSAADVCPETWTGEHQDWVLNDPDGKSLDETRTIREEIRQRVRELFDEIEQEVSPHV